MTTCSTDATAGGNVATWTVLATGGPLVVVVARVGAYWARRPAFHGAA